MESFTEQYNFNHVISLTFGRSKLADLNLIWNISAGCQ